jgi:hypothetical protein
MESNQFDQLDQRDQFEPHVVVAGLKFAIYEKTRSGQLSPSAKHLKEGILKIEGASLEECNQKILDFVNKNGVVILNEK